VKAHLALASAALFLAAAATVATPATAQPASLVGTYDGRQMEMAAGIELKADGRFRYGLSYGALDEEAVGRWTARGDQVLLTSDPVTAPRFVLVSQGRAADGMLQVSLDVPKGVSRQYFDALLLKPNGQAERKQLTEDGLSSHFTRDNVPSTHSHAVSCLSGYRRPGAARSEFRLRGPVSLRTERSRQGGVPGHALEDRQWRTPARPAWPNHPLQAVQVLNPAGVRNSLRPEKTKLGTLVERGGRAITTE